MVVLGKTYDIICTAGHCIDTYIETYGKNHLHLTKLRKATNLLWPKNQWCAYYIYYIRNKDFFRPLSSAVKLRGPPQDSATGWTGWFLRFFDFLTIFNDFFYGFLELIFLFFFGFFGFFRFLIFWIFWIFQDFLSDFTIF